MELEDRLAMVYNHSMPCVIFLKPVLNSVKLIIFSILSTRWY